MSQWYYTERHERRGPASDEQLKQLAASGTLKPTDLVWQTGMAAWRPASEVEGLFGTGEDEPPPIPPADVLPKPINKPLLAGTPPSPTAISVVLIALASLPFLSCLCAISVSRTGAVCGLIHNGFVILSAVLTLRKKAYWLAFVACFLVLFGWLWMPTGGLQLVSALISLPVGIWCVLSLRRPEIMQGFADQRDPFRWIKPLTLRRIGQIVFCIWLFSVLVFGLVKTKLEQEADYRETQERMENIAGAAHRIEVADKLWDQDQEAEAIREYISVLEKPRLIEDNDTKRRLYQRTVDYMVERGDITAAKQLLEQVISDSLVISLQSPKSQSLLTEAKAEHEQKQREAQEWMDRYRREQAQRENLKAIQQPPRDRRAVPGRPAARGTTPYAHLKGEVEAIIQAKYAEARKIHGVTENKDLPGDVLGQLFEECKTEVNALYSAMPALTIDCDTNCKDIISALTTSPPELESSFLGRFFKIPVKFRVKADMDEWKSGLVGIVCDKDGAVLTKGDVYLSTDASADEMVLGWFNGGGEDELAKAYSFRIHKKAKEPK